jgi:hypothetical protein
MSLIAGIGAALCPLFLLVVITGIGFLWNKISLGSFLFLPDDERPDP